MVSKDIIERFKVIASASVSDVAAVATWIMKCSQESPEVKDW